MKKLVFPILVMGYLLWASACTHKPEEHNHQEEPTAQEHEGHDHDAPTDEHAGHDHEAEEHDHSTCEGEHADNEGEQEHAHEDDRSYGIIEIKPQHFQEVIHCSGKIMPAQGDEITLTATHDGIVVFGNKSLFPGKAIRSGEKLVTISGKGMIHDNIENTFMDLKTSYETAKANYERAQVLNEDKITSDKELADIKMAFEKARNNFEIVKQNYSAGGQNITASSGGFVKDILVSEGQYVSTGQALVRITKNKRLVVKADVPQRYFSMLPQIQSANFITVYDEQLHKTGDLNGKLISYGKTTGDNSLFTPVYFEVDNVGNLLAGSFVEIYLKTAAISNAIVVPKSALLEEAGRYYVFAEEGEEFQKNYLTIDCNDGENYHILEGLNFGDHVATKNPYLIKLASMSSALPSHGHQH
ncbi:efflux RND transporter periplasmic adaptor subunit [Sunxiuqinia sp. sy24]|uniref:efflux RND transporter periplasmic adaptor subunit n=1 Tax=Sunxiuqinia sp. sy24 TaxID=3461495 RepID=UPI0040463500